MSDPHKPTFDVPGHRAMENESGGGDDEVGHPDPRNPAIDDGGLPRPGSDDAFDEGP